MYLRRPFIEIMHEVPEEYYPEIPTWELKKTLDHQKLANSICEHVANRNNPQVCYEALVKIMHHYPRISLYVPFWILKDAPEHFRDEYLAAWQKCWAYQDVEEAFNIGDILEKNCRITEPRRVVKAMHLIPWLVEYGYISTQDILQIMRCLRDDRVVTDSIFDAVTYMRQNETIGDEMFGEFDKYKHAPHFPYASLSQLYDTESRKQWLNEKAHNYFVQPGFKLRNPTGPFSANITEHDLDGKIALEEGKYYLIGGSRLKGYGRDRSDFDIYVYDELSGTINGFEPYAGRPSIIAHLLFNTMWVGRDERSTTWAQNKAVFDCLRKLDKLSRQECLIRMEMDLLQFRLMHKGIICAYPELFKDDPELSPIDIKSAFYKDTYRDIAIQIYAKYIQLPEELK